MSFRQSVLHYISEIPKGHVATYGQIAALAGSPRAARQVGGILSGLSTKEIDIPWWRVVNRHGYLSINNEDLDAKIKQKLLLESEGVKVSDDYYLDLGIYQ